MTFDPDGTIARAAAYQAEALARKIDADIMAMVKAAAKLPRLPDERVREIMEELRRENRI